MNDSIPPIPPAPQYPGNQVPDGYGPPPFAPHPPAGQPYPQRAQQPYPYQAPYPQQQYGMYATTAAGWDPNRPKSSGFRVAAGIVGIVCGAWFLVPSIAGFSAGRSTAFMAFLILVAALGNITCGIVLLANHRGRSQGAPVTSLSFAGFALLLGLIGLAVAYFGPALFVSALLLATPVLIVMGIGLSRERRSA
jgi:hypothetical protein